MDELRERIAENFKRLRKARGWTQAQAAERGGVDTSYIGQIEAALITFSLNAQLKWADVFDIDISLFHQPIGQDGAKDFSAAEASLVDLFRGLASEDKRQLLLALEGLIDQDKEKSRERIKNIRERLGETG